MSIEPQNRLILVTGATGFIGRRLIGTLRQQAGITICALVRDSSQVSRIWPAGDIVGRKGDLSRPETLSGVCDSVDTVFHLAGFAHTADMEEGKADELHARITVAGTQALLATAVRAGVKRFIFASSVKAMGEATDGCQDESAATAPESAYGRAKLAAERMVFGVGREQGMHVCSLRLPMVYGHDNKGNLPRMISAIDQHRFPPLPETGNKRSMVHVDDVVQALLLAAERPVAAGQTYIVADGQSYSTRRVYTLICAALGRRVPGCAVPAWALKLGARVGDLIGAVRGRSFLFNSDTLDKLIGSAWYSSARIERDLGYRPTRTLENALPEMIAEYRNSLSPEKLGARAVPR